MKDKGNGDIDGRKDRFLGFLEILGILGFIGGLGGNGETEVKLWKWMGKSRSREMGVRKEVKWT